MGIDDFVFEDALFRGAEPGMSAHPQVEMDALTMAAFASQPALSSSTPSFDPIRSSAAIEREPADVLGNWAEELKWLAAEIGTTRAPDTGAPDLSRDLGTSVDNLSQRALPVRGGRMAQGPRDEARARDGRSRDDRRVARGNCTTVRAVPRWPATGLALGRLAGGSFGGPESDRQGILIPAVCVQSVSVAGRSQWRAASGRRIE